MRRMLLISIISFFGDAMAQPDTVWTYASDPWIGYGHTLFMDGQSTLITRFRTYQPSGTPNWYTELAVEQISLDGERNWSIVPSNFYSTICDVHDIFQKPNGDYLLLGWSSSECMGLLLQMPTLACVSQGGELLWSRSYGGQLQLRDLVSYQRPFVVDESGCYFGCHIWGENFASLLKTSLDGDSLWTIDFDLYPYSKITGIEKARNGNLMVAGYESDNGTVNHAFVAQIDTLGSILAEWHLGLDGTVPYAMIRDDTTFVVVGKKSTSYIWCARLHEDCSEASYNETQVVGFSYLRVAMCASHDLLLAYFTSSGERLERRASDLALRWQNTNYFMRIFDIVVLEDGGFILVGSADEVVLVRTMPDNIESAQARNAIPSAIVLHSAFPNPFNPNTTITFDLAREMNVTLTAYDILGKQVATLVNGSMSAGTHEATFDATNLPSGIYFCRLEAGTFSQTQKLMLLK